MGSLKKKVTGKVFKKALAKNTKKSPLKVKAAKNPSGHQHPAPLPYVATTKSTVAAHQVGDGINSKFTVIGWKKQMQVVSFKKTIA